MFPNRFYFKAPQMLRQQRWISSERRLRYHWKRPVSGELPSRSRTLTDPKRPPLLLVKSFFNLRRRNTVPGKEMMRVTDELSFSPHRTFIDIPQSPDQLPINMTGSVDTVPRK